MMTWFKEFILKILSCYDRNEFVSLDLSGLGPHNESMHTGSWGQMREPRRPVPHSANVPGDFYVEENCCTMCGVPFVEAPALFGTYTDPAGYKQCFVKRQPGTSDELDHMIGAIKCAELQCIRYGGHDLTILQRLIQIGERSICDYPDEDK